MGEDFLDIQYDLKKTHILLACLIFFKFNIIDKQTIEIRKINID